MWRGFFAVIQQVIARKRIQADSWRRRRAGIGGGDGYRQAACGRRACCVSDADADGGSACGESRQRRSRNRNAPAAIRTHGAVVGLAAQRDGNGLTRLNIAGGAGYRLWRGFFAVIQQVIARKRIQADSWRRRRAGIGGGDGNRQAAGGCRACCVSDADVNGGGACRESCQRRSRDRNAPAAIRTHGGVVGLAAQRDGNNLTCFNIAGRAAQYLIGGFFCVIQYIIASECIQSDGRRPWRNRRTGIGATIVAAAISSTATTTADANGQAG